ncbi:MAG: hypothetical protein HND47_06910 [Chloroflexi bacterium]|nr:hypothetical protein [Chloroflexota bacterium]
MKTARLDYTFLFEPIQNHSTNVTLLTHPKDKRDCFTISINDNSLSTNWLSTVPSISADLLDLAIAIHAADRLIKRSADIPLSFRIKLPVRNFDTFSKSEVCNLLTDVLEWYTNDCWYFEFSKREISGRDVEVQPQLPLGIQPGEIEVALWSGGLDSLSGLHTRLLANTATHHVLVGTGSNFYVLKKQQQIAREIDQSFSGRTSLIQIPYKWSKTPVTGKNFDQRSRGLVFILIGVACAHHIGNGSLFIYENGVGAINLPYSKAEVGLDQARSVHPLSLLRVSKLVSSLLSAPFQVINPYLFWTKAQMVKSLVNNERKELIFLSSSCDRKHRRQDGIAQCGVCTSCLLRRQSLSALGIEDQTHYDKNLIDKDGAHFRAMQYQVNRIRFLLKQQDPWVSLSEEYHDLNDIADQISFQTEEEINNSRRQLIQLYTEYADEWKLFEEHIEKGTSNTMLPMHHHNKNI